MSKQKNQAYTTQTPAEQALVVEEETVQENTQEAAVTTTAAPEVTTTAAPVTTQVPTTTTAAPTTQPPTTQAPTTDAPVVEKAIDKQGVDLAVFENKVEWIKTHGSTEEKHTLTVLENYLAVCTTAVDLDKIAAEQKRLWRLFEYINSKPQHFQKLWRLVIDFAREHEEEAFDMSLFFRAQKGIGLAQDQLTCFNNLRTLIINTLKTKDVKKVKNLVDVRRIVEHDSIPEQTRGMYVAYYM
jgi:hypothetical protein